MSEEAWNGSVARECEGINRGRLWTRAEIERRLKDEASRDSQA
jgi:hypothetical protein